MSTIHSPDSEYASEIPVSGSNTTNATTSLLADAAESVHHNGEFEMRVLEAYDGDELNKIMEAMPHSVFSDGQSFTFNRVIKILIKERIIDPASVVAWNRANKSVKARVLDVIRRITIVTPNDVLLKIKSAILRKDVKKLKKASKLTKEDKFQNDCKAVFVAHAAIDVLNQGMINEYNIDPSRSSQSAEDILRIVSSKMEGVVNIFLNFETDEGTRRTHPDLYAMTPTLATFSSGEQFLKYLKFMKMKYDDLVDNMEKVLHSAAAASASSSSTDENSHEQILFQMCSKDTSYDYGLVYCYYLWKGRDLSFIPVNTSKLVDGNELPLICTRKRSLGDVKGVLHNKTSKKNRIRDEDGVVIVDNNNNINDNGDESLSDDSLIDMNVVGEHNHHHHQQQQQQQLSREQEEAYIAVKTAKANLLNLQAEQEARNFAISERLKEIEMLRYALNDKSFDKLTQSQRNQIQNRYSALLLDSQMNSYPIDSEIDNNNDNNNNNHNNGMDGNEDLHC